MRGFNSAITRVIVASLFAVASSSGYTICRNFKDGTSSCCDAVSTPCCYGIGGSSNHLMCASIPVPGYVNTSLTVKNEDGSLYFYLSLTNVGQSMWGPWHAHWESYEDPTYEDVTVKNLKSKPKNSTT